MSIIYACRACQARPSFIFEANSEEPLASLTHAVMQRPLHRFNHMRLDRPLNFLFWQRLLSSGVRVADGENADYYFLPIKVMRRQGGEGIPTLCLMSHLSHKLSRFCLHHSGPYGCPR